MAKNLAHFCKCNSFAIYTCKRKSVAINAEAMKRIAIAALLSLVLGSAAGQAQLYRYTAGHADIGVGYEDGEFEPHWHFGSGAVVDGVTLTTDLEAAPGEAYAYAGENTELSRPAGTQWDFLGTAAGNSVWVLPQTQAAGMPFLGLASEELDPLDWSGPIVFTLSDFSGPGVFSLWQSDGFGGPIVSMTTLNGVSSADFYAMSPGGHEHFNWGFTAPGTYNLTFLITGNHVSDGAVASEATFQIQVVPEPSSAALLALGMGAVVLLRRRHAVV